MIDMVHIQVVGLAGSRKVLVVDDEPDTVELVKTILEREGFVVVTANSGEECLRTVDKDDLDLVLLDIMMPGMSGWDVYQRIRKSSKDVKVAFLSVLEVSKERKKRLMREGLAGYITKPFSKDGWVGNTKRMVEGG